MSFLPMLFSGMMGSGMGSGGGSMPGTGNLGFGPVQQQSPMLSNLANLLPGLMQGPEPNDGSQYSTIAPSWGPLPGAGLMAPGGSFGQAPQQPGNGMFQAQGGMGFGGLGSNLPFYLSQFGTPGSPIGPVTGGMGNLLGNLLPFLLSNAQGQGQMRNNITPQPVARRPEPSQPTLPNGPLGPGFGRGRGLPITFGPGAERMM